MQVPNVFEITAIEVNPAPRPALVGQVPAGSRAAWPSTSGIPTGIGTSGGQR
jgi:hypothetical protein